MRPSASNLNTSESFRESGIDFGEEFAASIPTQDDRPCGSCYILLLPVEILAEIFVCLQGSETKSIAPYLRQVNRHWQAVADVTPALWSNLNIKAGDDPDLIAAFLSRSSSYPITLTIAGTTTARIPVISPEEFGLWASQCATILHTHIRHCQSLSITEHWVKPDALSKLLKVLVQVPASALQELIITPEYIPDHKFHKPPPKVSCGGIESLVCAKFTITGLHFCTIPFGGINELHLGGAGDLFLGFTQFCSLLEECTQLATLAIYNNVVDTFPILSQHSCYLPNLASLQIFGTMNAVSELLLCLSVPNLTELVVIPIVIEDFNLLSSQTVTQRKSIFPQIRRLSLAPTVYHSNMTEDSIYAAMLCFPNIEHLLLVNLNDKAFSYAFNSTHQGRPVPWPQLHTLSIRNVTDTIERTITKFLDHRTTSGYIVPTIQVDSHSIEALKPERPRFPYEFGDPWSVLLQKMIRTHASALRDLYAGVESESGSDAED